MFTQRHTAYKINVKELISNEYVQRPGESDYVKFNELQISRARLIATVVNKGVYDEKKSGFLVIDDGTETIRVRGWEDQYDIIDKANISDLVEVIGRVRKYNEEVYIIPEVIKKTTPNWFALRKIELNNGKVMLNESVKEERTIDKENSLSKDSVCDIIKSLDKGKGAELNEIIEQLKIGKEECLTVIRELMNEGLVFEPKSNKFKTLD